MKESMIIIQILEVIIQINQYEEEYIKIWKFLYN
jgi:hypothetical protein